VKKFNGIRHVIGAQLPIETANFNKCLRLEKFFSFFYGPFKNQKTTTCCFRLVKFKKPYVVIFSTMLVTINYKIYLIQIKFSCFEFRSNCFIIAQHVSFIY
jgi:hypothetical protein